MLSMSANAYNQKGVVELTDGLPWGKFSLTSILPSIMARFSQEIATTIGLPAEFALEGADFEVKDDGNCKTAVVDASSKQLH